MPMNESPEITRWWWVRHAPVPDTGNIYGQEDLDCDCGDRHVFAAVAHDLPRGAVWVTSNLKRTHQTAAAIVQAMAQEDAAAGDRMPVPEFAEQHFGDWQGMNRAKFLASRGADPHPFWFGPSSERAPGGESFDDLLARVVPAIERLSAEYRGRDIVAVAHGGTIKAAIAHALGLGAEAGLAFMIENCSVTRLERLSPANPAPWRVAAVNHRPWAGQTGATAPGVMA
jgi:alpha-ribazole phosphatase